MRRLAAGLFIGLFGAGVLSGCIAARVSYDDGFAVGQSYAAAAARGTLDGHAALAACRRQWITSAPATDVQRQWLSGCVNGIRRVEANLGG